MALGGVFLFHWAEFGARCGELVRNLGEFVRNRGEFVRKGREFVPNGQKFVPNGPKFMRNTLTSSLVRIKKPPATKRRRGHMTPYSYTIS